MKEGAMIHTWTSPQSLKQSHVMLLGDDQEAVHSLVSYSTDEFIAGWEEVGNCEDSSSYSSLGPCLFPDCPVMDCFFSIICPSITLPYLKASQLWTETSADLSQNKPFLTYYRGCHILSVSDKKVTKMKRQRGEECKLTHTHTRIYPSVKKIWVVSIFCNDHNGHCVFVL